MRSDETGPLQRTRQNNVKRISNMLSLNIPKAEVVKPKQIKIAVK